MRSPPHANSITKHRSAAVWKQPYRLTRNGWRLPVTTWKIRFSIMMLQGWGWGEEVRITYMVIKSGENGER
jgi:hypothetical protein